jgi:predicted aldo/keto reductase-like oxidoreductase
MSESYLGKSIKKLGFGYMRLPRKDGRFDVDAVNEMVDEFMSHGFSYYDTSYIYEGSEEALRESLVKRYPRHSFQIATKISLLNVNSPEQHYDRLNTSLARLGVDYVDFYLIHALSEASAKTADSLNTWEFMRGVKEKGLAKHIGFSFHGAPELLDETLTKHPEMEMVQLQINYLDWENPEVQSRRCYEIARKHNKPVSIMEPTKGGLLAGGESEATDLLRKANPSASPASWAFRFVGELEGLITALSGMENISQIRDNAATFNHFKPLTKEERELIAKVVEIINATPRIPCTRCRYCAPHCPKQIQIPMFIGIYNTFLVHRQKSSSGYTYASMSNFGVSPAECVKCRECEKHCPQRIEISDVLAKLVDELDGVKENYILRSE